MNTNNAHTKKLLLNREDLKALGIWQSNSTLIRQEALGRFPKRVRLSAAAVCWSNDEVLAWIDERKADRDGWHYADAS